MDKLPSKVMIKGQEWVVNYAPLKDEGSFDCQSRIIQVDNTSDEDRQAQILLHEIMEACMCENGLSFQPYPNGDGEKMFVMGHRAFKAFCKDVYAAIKEIL